MKGAFSFAGHLCVLSTEGVGIDHVFLVGVEELLASRGATRVQWCFKDTSFRRAVSQWFSDEAAAVRQYGHIADWDTSQVTDLSYLFEGRYSFNENIGSWNSREQNCKIARVGVCLMWASPVATRARV